MTKPSQQATRADYQLLGVKPGVATEDLRAAYKSLVKRWHPDRFVENTAAKLQAEEKLKTINAAYSRLRDDTATPPGQVHAAAANRQNHGGQPPDTGQRRRYPGKDAPPLKPAAARQPRTILRFATSLARSQALRTSWLRFCFTLLPLFMVAALWTDRPGPPLGGDRSSMSVTDQRSAHNPLPPGGISRHAAPAPPPALPTNPPLEAKAPARTVIVPPRVGPRRPIDAQAEERPHFTLGSLKHEVVRIQGKPQRINGQSWVYGLSEVSFKDGRVSGYNNFDGSLNVKLTPSAPVSPDNPPQSFGIGANRDEVLAIQGTPTRVEGGKWYYGLSEVTLKDGKVVAYNNFFHSLRVFLQPRGNGNLGLLPKYFTIGSTPDEVLTVQGTPTSVQANLWSYELSNVWFYEGKVRAINDFSNVLKFRSID